MEKLKILLSKGRIYENVTRLLSDIGISIQLPERTYFPITNREDLTFQVVKPQVASLLLSSGKADVAFSGFDWVVENSVESEVSEVLDLGFDKVKIVAAIPNDRDEKSLREPVTVATEYETLAKNWLKKRGMVGKVFRTWGTSEGFVRSDEASPADVLIDNTATGSSLRANNLRVIDTIMSSSTRFYASKKVLLDCEKERVINELKMLFESVLRARERVMLEMNVRETDFSLLVEALPSMKSPTVSPLFNSNLFSVKTVALKSEVASLLPRLKELGAMDIVEYELRKVIP